jgi:hypothetical protein
MIVPLNAHASLRSWTSFFINHVRVVRLKRNWFINMMIPNGRRAEILGVIRHSSTG